MARMTLSPDDEERQEYLQDNKNWYFRFDGRELPLAYATTESKITLPDNLAVRIYDHAGFINLRYLNVAQMRELLEKRIGNDVEKISELLDAWQDWIDNDELKRLNGAENEYYEELKPPYRPRNAMVETTEEILLIRDFAEVFKELELETAFTVYGNMSGVNPNLATKETLSLLPGLSSAGVDKILERRQAKEFQNLAEFSTFLSEVSDIIPLEEQAKLRPWLNFSTTNYYTIMILPKKYQSVKFSKEALEKAEKAAKSDKDKKLPPPPPPESDKNQRAYSAVVQFIGFNERPKILMVNPYGVVPDNHFEFSPEERKEREELLKQSTTSSSSSNNRTMPTPPATSEKR
jgi:general secretion pathway protein K